jgi:putative transposase
MALKRHPAPTIHHSDQGSQYTTPLYTGVFPIETLISMSAVGQPTENGLAERFMRTLKEEYIDFSDFEDFDDAERQIAHWLEVEYMTERVHSALGYLTPAEFETLALTQSESLLLTA